MKTLNCLTLLKEVLSHDPKLDIIATFEALCFVVGNLLSGCTGFFSSSA